MYKKRGKMNSKEKIIDTYKMLVIKKQGSKVTVKEICEVLEISRTTFYKYFKDSYDILEYIFVNDAMQPIEFLISANLDTKTIIEGWYLSFYRNKEFYCYAIRDESQNSLFNTVINKLTVFNMKLYENYVSKEDVEYYAYKYASLQAMLLKKWMFEGMVVEPKKMAEYFITDI